MTKPIILASISPRRRGLFKLFDLNFKAVDSGYEEILHKHLSHSELVKFLALGKAKAAAKKYKNSVIVAADTIVSFNGKAIGKPKNRKDAFLTLKSFSGKSQDVFTGVAVMDAKTGKIFNEFCKSRVYFKKVSDKNINEYLDTGEAMDKAGSFGPLGKGLNLIERIEGDTTNVIGLPMEFVFKGLNKVGVKF
jgi:septum formation protein